MITASAARALLAIASSFVFSSCVLTSNPVVTSAPEAAVLKKRFTEQMRDLELATGKLPYEGSSPFQVAVRHASLDPIELPEWLRETALGKVVGKALEKE